MKLSQKWKILSKASKVGIITTGSILGAGIVATAIAVPVTILVPKPRDLVVMEKLTEAQVARIQKGAIALAAKEAGIAVNQVSVALTQTTSSITMVYEYTGGVGTNHIVEFEEFSDGTFDVTVTATEPGATAPTTVKEGYKQDKKVVYDLFTKWWNLGA